MKDGYVRRDVPIRVSSTSPWDVDVRLQHIDRYQLIGPSDIVAGESSRLHARVDLDDGSTETGSLYVELSSDDSAVLDIQPTGWITGVAPGVATIAARYYGAATTLLIRVTAKK